MGQKGKRAVNVAKGEENIWIIQTAAFVFNTIVHEGSTDGNLNCVNKMLRKFLNNDLY